MVLAKHVTLHVDMEQVGWYKSVTCLAMFRGWKCMRGGLNSSGLGSGDHTDSLVWPQNHSSVGGMGVQMDG